MTGKEPRLIPVNRVSEHNKSCTADVDFLSIALSPVFKPGLFRIMVCSQSAAVFKARITRNGNTQTVAFNSGTDLVANALYIFDMLVHEGDAVNFQFSATLTMSVFRAQEIVAGTQ